MIDEDAIPTGQFNAAPDPVAAALESIAFANLAMAAALAASAETNAVLAGQMDRLVGTIRGVQGKIGGEIGPMIERQKANAEKLAAELELRRSHVKR